MAESDADEPAENSGSTETLDPDPDDLAGVVDLFGALTNAELKQALGELAYKSDVEPPGPEIVELALQRYVLVAYDLSNSDSPASTNSDRFLVPGPSAFPSLLKGATDLPHIMDVPTRSPNRKLVEKAVEARFRGDVAQAVADENAQLVRRLLDVSYDLDAWGIAMAELRERLDNVLS
jgi:hypothetical protein